MILLRRNNQVDEDYDITQHLSEGTIIAVKSIDKYKTLVDTIKYILPNNHPRNLHNFVWSSNLNCFDYVKQAKK